jgi:hypothetical protein
VAEGCAKAENGCLVQQDGQRHRRDQAGSEGEEAMFEAMFVDNFDGRDAAGSEGKEVMFVDNLNGRDAEGSEGNEYSRVCAGSL